MDSPRAVEEDLQSDSDSEDDDQTRKISRDKSIGAKISRRLTPQTKKKPPTKAHSSSSGEIELKSNRIGRSASGPSRISDFARSDPSGIIEKSGPPRTRSDLNPRRKDLVESDQGQLDDIEATPRGDNQTPREDSQTPRKNPPLPPKRPTKLTYAHGSKPPVDLELQQQLIERLYNAAMQGQTRELKELLTQLAAPDLINSKAKNGKTVLQAASIFGDIEAVIQLLSLEGVNVDVCCPTDGNTALHYATLGEHEEIIALLLIAGARTNFQNLSHQTARSLHLESEAWLCYEKEGLDGLTKQYPRTNDIKRQQHGVNTRQLVRKMTALRLAAQADNPTDAFLQQKIAQSIDELDNTLSHLGHEIDSVLDSIHLHQTKGTDMAELLSLIQNVDRALEPLTTISTEETPLDIRSVIGGYDVEMIHNLESPRTPVATQPTHRYKPLPQPGSSPRSVDPTESERTKQTESPTSRSPSRPPFGTTPPITPRKISHDGMNTPPLTPKGPPRPKNPITPSSPLRTSSPMSSSPIDIDIPPVHIAGLDATGGSPRPSASPSQSPPSSPVREFRGLSETKLAIPIPRQQSTPSSPVTRLDFSQRPKFEGQTERERTFSSPAKMGSSENRTTDRENSTPKKRKGSFFPATGRTSSFALSGKKTVAAPTNETPENSNEALYDSILNDPSATPLQVSHLSSNRIRPEGKSPLVAWLMTCSPGEAKEFGKYCQTVDRGNDFACLFDIIKLEQDKLVDRQRAAQTLIQTHISPTLKISIDNPIITEDLMRKAVVGWTLDGLFHELEVALVDTLKKHWEKWKKHLNSAKV